MHGVAAVPAPPRTGGAAIGRTERARRGRLYTRAAGPYAPKGMAPGCRGVLRCGPVYVLVAAAAWIGPLRRRFPWPSRRSSRMLGASMTTVRTAIAQTRRGISAAVRSRAGVLVAVAMVVAVFNLVAPVLLLSLVKRPADFFTFNPWLQRLPDYLGSSEPLSAKLPFLAHLTIAWVSAEGAEGIDWGYIVDVPTLLRIVCTALVFGAYFALWSYG